MLIVLVLTGCLSSDGEQEASDSPPNVILIISDDHSWTDYSFMGHSHVETPNIDNLSSEGLTFTRGYLAAPFCRPSLASIITGLYPHQHGVTGNDPAFEFKGEERYGTEWLIARDSVNSIITQRFNKLPNLPKLLSEKGYLSLQTGKWWEGSWQDAGFTHGMTHGDPRWGGRHGDEGLDIGREGIPQIENFIDRAESVNKPFFVWYSPFLPHTPHNPPDSLLNKYLDDAPTEQIAKYWAMIEWLDVTIGQLLSFVKERGLAKETLVIYVADNGWIQNPKGQGFKWPSKQSPYDMGIRTPMIFKWPGHISKSKDTTTLVSSVDIAPTILDAVDIDPTDGMSGVSIMNSERLESRESVFSEDYNHDIRDVKSPTKSLEHRVIISTPWKLISPEGNVDSTSFESSGGGRFIPFVESTKLYNIVEDPHENENLADERPEVVDDLRQRLDDWWEPDS